MTSRSLLHLHLESGPLTLDFQGGQEQVAQVAAELSASSAVSVTVTIDDRVTTEMPKLPCSRLWDEPGHAPDDFEPVGEMNRASATSRKDVRNAHALRSAW